MHYQRLSGILLHPTSLPGPEGIGSFGSEARKFVDFLHFSGQGIWQILPLGPTGFGNCPYSCFSAFAGNPLLISMEILAAEGDIEVSDLAAIPAGCKVNYDEAAAYKVPLLAKAAQNFFNSQDQNRKHDFWNFCDSTFWLHDYALFMACKKRFKGKVWQRWPSQLAVRNYNACVEYSELLGNEIGVQKYIQWQFFRQWRSLKSYANERGVMIVGDAPIFVAYDSADVWCNRHIFQLDDTGKPIFIAGVPPDYFSKTGQLWGNPLYDWKRLAEDGYGWWVARLQSDLNLYDQVRIDHFRGFEASWSVPYGQKTAIKGEWIKGPGESLFNMLQQKLGSLPIIAEDLGVITPEVEQLRDWFQLPGMKILQFAFEGNAGNGYLPHNHIPNSVVYTGTHDNDTTQGWFNSMDECLKKRVTEYLQCSYEDVVWQMIRAAQMSVARYAIVPMQDLLSLDSTARMNVPGVAAGNWEWRSQESSFTDEIAERLRAMTSLSNRIPG